MLEVLSALFCPIVSSYCGKCLL